jgi:hypothetical protein
MSNCRKPRYVRGTLLVVLYCTALLAFLAMLWVGILAGVAAIALAHPTKWYRVGDPPAAEMAVMFGGLSLIFALVVACCLAGEARLRVGTRTKLGLRVTKWLGALWFSLTCLGVLGVAFRHFGDWALLRDRMRHYEFEIRSRSSQASGTLTGAEYATVKAELFAKPVIQRLGPLDPPAEVFLYRASPPYVAVNLGHGNVAMFELTSMWCEYAD